MWLDAGTFHGKIAEFDGNPDSPKLRIALPSFWSYSGPFPPRHWVYLNEIWVSKAELENLGLGAEVLVLPLYIQFREIQPGDKSEEEVYLAVLILKPTGTSTDLGPGVEDITLLVYQRTGSSFLECSLSSSSKLRPFLDKKKPSQKNMKFFQRVSGIQFEKKIFFIA